MPRERPTSPPFEPEELPRSLDRYLSVGLVFMFVLILGFITYTIREPDLRATAQAEQDTTYRDLGSQLFEKNCASCHGKGAIGGSAPRLDAKEFLKLTSNDQMHLLVVAGISGTDMPAWSIDYGGALTHEQINQLVTYIRSLEPDAPSVPAWRKGAAGNKATTDTTAMKN
jgi:mono/diheme cytochrome c family protein